ncbi:Retinol dehydrogenase 13-like [Oopsacas minuta]|uniref:Retinol dehydrogenase 13-like n=1 Tax=Oopsacas minuta TaxID=111878 RepID=A0AAV7JGR9_9METZ|nr:Retinol dehydrogenase 13-like [Oopsacas minuta]
MLIPIITILVCIFLILRYGFDFVFVSGVCVSKRRLDGKNVIITGGNVGLGYETAVDLARRGARVIIACRDEKKGLNAERKIRLESNNDEVFYQHLNLASLSSVREFSRQINESSHGVDILINNAGVMGCPLTYTEDGYEMQFATNHLGHFLLTNLLLDKLKAAPEARIVNVSSLGAKFTWSFKFDNVTPKEAHSYSPMATYTQTKLANILFTIHLADLLRGTNVTCNSLHPGSVNTELARHMLDKIRKIKFGWLLASIYDKIIGYLIKDSKLGAQTQIYLAVSEELVGVTGKYFSDCVECSLRPSWTKNNAMRLWEMSERMVGMTPN